MYRIRDWNIHFERDRTRQWKRLEWVPIPTKQGAGYRKIMALKNGTEVFGVWIALVEVASTCTPRGDLSKHSIDDLSLLTMIDKKKLLEAIDFLSTTLDWVEKLTDNDKILTHIDNRAHESAVGSSILFNSIQSNSIQDRGCKGEGEKQRRFVPPTLEEIQAYITEKQYTVDPVKFLAYYTSNGWRVGKNKMHNWKAAVVTWQRNQNEGKRG